MQRPRGEPPDDPEKPLDVPSIELCLGQVWLRGGSAASSLPKVSCSRSLALAATCLRTLWGKDAAEAPSPESLLDTRSAAAWAAAKEGILQAVLNGDLDNLLATMQPASYALVDSSSNKSSSTSKQGASTSASLALSLAKTLEAGDRPLPEVVCQAVADAPELLRRGLTQESLQDACTGLGIEGLPDAAAAMNPRDGCFGRLVLALEWSHVSIVDDDSFEVPMHVAGTSPSHPHPVFYLATSDDEVFVVVIPFHDMKTVPASDEIFAACTDILRAMTPIEDSPYSAVKLFNLDVRQAAQTNAVENTVDLGMPAESLHVAEFASLSVSSGRVMPGQLNSEGGTGQPFLMRRPFALCIWHAEMDEINAPLSAMLVE